MRIHLCGVTRKAMATIEIGHFTAGAGSFTGEDSICRKLLRGFQPGMNSMAWVVDCARLGATLAITLWFQGHW